MPKEKARLVTIVTVQCPQCKAKRDIRVGEVADDDFPMCEKDGMPMTAVSARQVEETR